MAQFNFAVLAKYMEFSAFGRYHVHLPFVCEPDYFLSLVLVLVLFSLIRISIRTLISNGGRTGNNPPFPDSSLPLNHKGNSPIFSSKYLNFPLTFKKLIHLNRFVCVCVCIM